MTTTFADLVNLAQPRIIDHEIDVTEGRDWKFVLTFVDSADAAIDLSGVTWTCLVLTDLDGSTVATWTVTADSSGVMTGVLADGSTGGKAAGATKDRPYQVVWYCKGVKSGDSVQFWGPGGSPFRIWGE